MARNVWEEIYESRIKAEEEQRKEAEDIVPMEDVLDKLAYNISYYNKQLKRNGIGPIMRFALLRDFQHDLLT